jgi:hypothetical protein
MVAGSVVERNPQMTKRTLRILSSAIAAMGVLVGPAAALEVASSATVAGTPDAVWQKIGDFCAIQVWYPSVSKCEQTDEAGATYRTLTATDGGTIKEKLVEKTETSYTYASSKLHFLSRTTAPRSVFRLTEMEPGWTGRAASMRKANRTPKPRL